MRESKELWINSCPLIVFAGTHLATLPVDPKVGKILLMGALFQCLAPALTMAAAVAYRDPFVCPDEHRDEALKAHKKFDHDQNR